MPRQMQWRVHTSALLQEIAQNGKVGDARIPLQILGDLLYQVAERAAQLNDPKLNVLMLRLALYSVADPSSRKYSFRKVERYIQEATHA